MQLLISKNIARYRREKNITQDELATALDVTPQAVSNWERGGYPDITLLPGLANYFGVTIDELMGNDEIGKKEDIEGYYAKIKTIENAEERLLFAMEYHRKYPDNVELMQYAAMQGEYCLTAFPEKQETYYPVIRDLCVRLLDFPDTREYAIRRMVMLCPDSELPEWLEKSARTPFFTRRSNLLGRYLHHLRDDTENAYIQQSLSNLENLTLLLDTRYPDKLGPVKKAAYHRSVLALMDALRDENGDLPDGWLLLYGYKSMVLAACLFGYGKTEEGWTAFEEGLAMMKRWFTFPEEEVLDLGGGEFLGGLKIRKDWYHAVTPDGQEHLLYDTTSLCYYDAHRVLEFLTNPQWAWFNPAREDERFVQAVAWAKELAGRTD